MIHDLLVIGGGPAGATCARRAAQNGLDVVLIDKQTFPRPKPCGGALGPKVLEILDIDYSHIVERDFHAARIYRPSGKTSVLTRDDMKGHLVRRFAFDNYLLDTARDAGVEVILENEIVAIEQLRRGVRALGVGDSYKAHLLVGADGVNGPIMKQLGIRTQWAPDEVAVCIVGEVQVESSKIEQIMIPDTNSDSTCIELYYGLVERGYGWCFPYKESLNIGIGCRTDKAGGLREKWVRLLARISKEKNIETQGIETTSARVPFGNNSGRIIGRRSMLIGDAAGLVSPISGEGISFSIESGILAAEVATETVRERSPTHVVEYDRRMKKTLLAELNDLNTLSNILYKSEANFETLFDITDNDHIIREYITDIFTRKSSFSSLKYKIAKRLLSRHPRKALKLGL